MATHRLVHFEVMYKRLLVYNVLVGQVTSQRPCSVSQCQGSPITTPSQHLPHTGRRGQITVDWIVRPLSAVTPPMLTGGGTMLVSQRPCQHWSALILASLA